MRFKQNFTLYPRKTKLGIVWYYRSYDDTGKRTSGISTGQKSKAKAQKFVEDLYQDRTLLITNKQEQKIKDIITELMRDNSAFFQPKINRGTKECPGIDSITITQYRNIAKFYIIPFLGDYKCKYVTPEVVNNYQEFLIKKGLKRSTINGYMQKTKALFNFLELNEYINKNPFKHVKSLIDDEDKVDAFTLEECQLIINNSYSYKSDYKNNRAKFIYIILMTTGLRVDEALALTLEDIHHDYIDITKQQTPKGKIKPTKTKQKRKIPICNDLYDFIMKNQKYLNDLPLYSTFNRYTLILFRSVFNEGEYKKRKLRIHSFRHFYNTYLLSENVPGVKVDAVIGHSTGRGSMLELYTNWNVKHFPEVIEANKKLCQELRLVDFNKSSASTGA